MTEQNVRIAVGRDPELNWDARFTEALDEKAVQGYPLEYDLLNMEGKDWMRDVLPYDLIFWKPPYMGPQAANHFKEKIYTLQTELGKRVLPNYQTVWHFESKIAQSYLFQAHDVPSARTTVSFDYHDAVAQLEGETYPIVLKDSYGAGSRNVRLVKDFAEARKEATRTFANQLWHENRKDAGPGFLPKIASLSKPWFWSKLAGKALNAEHYRAMYWQEFLPGNPADLRIAAIGDRYAVGFWRKNRPNDFRASGSGLLDYASDVPEAPIRYCLELNRKLGFDSMAYDVLWKDGEFVVIEISYAYLDKAVYNAPGHYELVGDRLEFKEGHTWPQRLWVEWALHGSERKAGSQPG